MSKVGVRFEPHAWMQRLVEATRSDAGHDPAKVEAGDRLYSIAQKLASNDGATALERGQVLWNARATSGMPGLAELLVDQGAAPLRNILATARPEDLVEIVDALSVRMLGTEGGGSALSRLLDLKIVCESGRDLAAAYDDRLRSTPARHRPDDFLGSNVAEVLDAIATRLGELAATEARKNFGAGLGRAQQATQEPPRNRTPIRNEAQATAYAAGVLEAALIERGVNPGDANVAIRFPSSQWSAKNFSNQKQIRQQVEQVAGFLAQFAKDAGHQNGLEVLLTPAGKLHHLEGVEGDSLYVPVRAGHSEVTLREAWDDGAFIRPDNAFNPLDHLAAAKKRKIWSLGLNPTGALRVRMRRLFRRFSSELSTAIGDVESRAAQMDDSTLRDHVRTLARRFVSADAKDDKAGGFLERVLDKIAGGSRDDLLGMLDRWRSEATNDAGIEGLAEGTMGVMGNKLVDKRNKRVLINVDTRDLITVAPSPILQRHADAAVNEVILEGDVRALISVTSTDMVTVVPELAKMLFGGATLERAGIDHPPG